MNQAARSARLQKVGVLLINLGTPNSPATPDVRRYLREFLMDPRVVDIPYAARWALVHLIILPLRPKRSGAAYAKIWTDKGSPLLAFGQALCSAVQNRLGDHFKVELAMRYGTPAIADGLGKMMAADLSKIIVVPLYPQYASASTGSSLERVFEIAGRAWNVSPIEVVGDFYDDPGFIDAFRTVAQPILSSFVPDHVLFSYHGLPERQIKRSDPSGQHCLSKPDCCEQIQFANRRCYRAQCVATTRALASQLGLSPQAHSMSFQSRLGRTKWIEPYTDMVLPELAQRGIRRLAVLCPAFVADCLETLEEIGLRAQEQWHSLGGEALQLVPSLNAEPRWVEALTDLILRQTGNCLSMTERP